MITGSFIGYRLKIPMGSVLGAMLLVGAGKALSVLTLVSNTPLSFLVQLLLGMMIGLSFKRLSKKQFIEVRNSLVFVIFSVVLMTILTGYIVSSFPVLSLAVSILSSAPGGMVEMATMANALELEAPIVIFLHFIRLLLVMLLFPQIIKYFYTLQKLSLNQLNTTQPVVNEGAENKMNTASDYFLLVMVASIGAVLGYLTQFPIGALLGSLLMVIVVNLKTNQFGSLPVSVKRGIQTLIGGNIGLTFSSETFLILPQLIVPALVITTLTIAFALLLSFLLSRIARIDYLTALCGLAPAGMSEMVLIAEHYHANIPTVVTMHVFRIITIIVVIPLLVYNLI